MRGKSLGCVAGFVGLCLLVPFAALAAPASESIGQPIETALLPLNFPDARPSAHNALPRVLSEPDAQHYRHIFAAQDEANWAEADREIHDLNDRRLLGVVLAQRYLHAKYRSRHDEVASWLKQYGDLPDATRIYRLALNRKPPSAPALQRPAAGFLAGSGDTDPAASEIAYQSDLVRSDGDVQRILNLTAEIRSAVHGGDMAGADRLLRQAEASHLYDVIELGMVRAEVARGHFLAGADARAFALASEAAKAAGSYAPGAYWIAGLSAFRSGRYDQAARHFGALADLPDASAWTQSAAAFWTARAYLWGRQPREVTRWTVRAALNKNTFYGLVARRALGVETPFNWVEPRLGEAEIGRLTGMPGGFRALALIQIGEYARAEAELRRLYPQLGAEDAPTILGLAARANMPALAMRLAGHLAAYENTRFDGALYPIPDWRPAGGFSVDPALLFAIMRQESAFDHRARSYSGASGLMQLMPATAAALSDGGRHQRVKNDKLFDPEHNLTLGQRYVQHLLEQDSIHGNLLVALAAYNAGPSAALRWQRSEAHRDDPLLFLESIPLGETRVYVERVLANFWIYQLRLGQPTPTLDAIAAGDWPVYSPAAHASAD